MMSILGTGVIEGNITYLEKEKDGDNVRIVAVGEFERIVSLDGLNDFLKNTKVRKEVKEELEFLITEANNKWLKKEFRS